jgi:signal peptidase I
MSLALAGCLIAGLVAYASQVVFVSRAVTSDDMAPGLAVGETIIVDNTAFWARNPFRGEVVWMESPAGRVFRRVLGVPGDEVVVRGGKAVVNGHTLPETYAHGVGTDYGPTVLPERSYFVLADDRERADARTWGPTPAEDIFGSAAFTRNSQGSFEPIQRARMPEPLEP